MMSDVQEGFLLISDISAYTMYLSESELDHAKETLAALIEVLIEHNRPPLVISRLEGDAVISYGLQENFLSGQSFIELLESTYVAFRKAIERMVLNNTCQCKACANVSLLDLKFIIHYGEFAVQHIAEHHELVGRDVNLIHRLLKNRVQEALGFKAYMLCTESVIRKLGLTGIQTSMVRHTESYDDFGEVKVWVKDMHPIWKQSQAKTIVELAPDQIDVYFEIEIEMPLEFVWDYLTRPDFRAYLHGSDRQEVVNRTDGRIGPDSIYQCYHGDKAIPHTILEWQPFKRILTRELAPVPIKGTTYIAEYRLLPSRQGTTLRISFSNAKGPFLGRVLMRLMDFMMNPIVKRNLVRFKEKTEEDLLSNRGGLQEGAMFTTDEINEAAGNIPRQPSSGSTVDPPGH